jgi:dihydrofolate reductase
VSSTAISHHAGPATPAARQTNERDPKVLFSNSLTSADWAETTIAAGDLAEAVEAGLIDEYRLLVHPAVLGAGEWIFPTR